MKGATPTARQTAVCAYIALESLESRHVTVVQLRPVDLVLCLRRCELTEGPQGLKGFAWGLAAGWPSEHRVDAFRPNIDSTFIQCVEDTGPFTGASQITVSWCSGA